MIRPLLRWVSLKPDALIARRLGKRAAALRDAGQFRAAAALYEEALALTPERVRLHIQAGHMFKEAGDYARAEEHYSAAVRALPDDADLALQLGHFHKLAGRPAEAEAAYRRATVLRPGWAEAGEELARISTSVEGLAIEGLDGDALDRVIPELLPSAGVAAAVHHDTIQVRRLGARRRRSRWGTLKLLSGIEAIRGWCIASSPVTALEVVLDGRTIRREALIGEDFPGAAPGQARYVFNLWHDFTAAAPGPQTIELRFIEASGRQRAHRETVLIAPPGPDDACPASDAYVTVPESEGSLDDQVNALPSMIRSTERTLLPDPVRAILVQRVDQMGDLAASVPAIRRLREIFPGARMVGLVGPANEGLARSIGLFDELVTAHFPDDPQQGRRVMSAAEQERVRRALAPYAFDIAIDLGENTESRPLLLLSGARFLYGFKDREARFLSAGLDFNAHDPVNALEVMPPSRKLLLLVEGLAVLRRNPGQPMPREGDPAALEAVGLKPGERFAVLHAGARLAYSRWPGFPALIEGLLARTDLRIVLFADPDDARPLPSHPRLTVVHGQIAFEQFDALLSACRLFVGNDSGPKHLAALRGAPVVSVHMARLNWSEWGQEHRGAIVSRRVPCAGCGIGHDGGECGKAFACIRHIAPDEVLEAALSLL